MTAIQHFLFFDCSPFLCFLSLTAEQQKGKQGWLPLPLLCRTAHWAFGLLDCHPRAGALHAMHRREYSAAQTRSSAFPCLLKAKRSILHGTDCLLWIPITWRKPMWGRVLIHLRLWIHSQSIFEEDEANQSWTCHFSIPYRWWVSTTPPCAQAGDVRDVLLIKKKTHKTPKYFMYFKFLLQGFN